MFLAWLIAFIVPTLAILGGSWLVGHLAPDRNTVLGDPMLMLIQFFLAASPLLALAIFSLVSRARHDAVRRAAIVAGLVTLAVWGWYHAGALGLEPAKAGVALLASPVAIGILALILYRSMARTT